MRNTATLTQYSASAFTSPVSAQTLTDIFRARSQAMARTCCTGGGLFPLLLAAILLTLGSAPVLSAENKADVAGYCVKQFGATAFANVDRRDNGLLCSVRTDGGLGLTHNKIKAADVCAKQQGTRRFRRDGQDVICLKGPGNTAAQADRSIDLEKYCKKAYGANAFPTVRRTDNTPMCSVRTDGGLGLRHYIIDTAGLCGGGTPRSDAKTLYCGGGAAGTATSSSGENAGSGAPASPATGAATSAATPSNSQRPAPGEPLDAGGDGMLTGKTVTLADLEGCGGIYFFDLDDKYSMRMATKELFGFVSTPCPGLANGRIATQADYFTFCQQFKEPRDEGMWAVRNPDGLLPRCSTFPGPFSPGYNQTGLRGTPAGAFCSMLHYGLLASRDTDLISKAIREGVSSAFKYDRKSRKLECFYLSKAQMKSLSQQYKKLKKDSGPEQEYVEDEM